MNTRIEVSYADGIEGLSFDSGIVRIDFFQTVPDTDGTNGADGPAETVVLHNRLVMPIKGFLDAYAKMSNLMAKLEEAKIVERNADTSLQAKGRSPNFQ